jgi:transposase
LTTNHQKGPSVPIITTIGVDLAKKVFQVHGVDAEGRVVVARKLRRKEVLAFFAKLPPCVVGMEACGSAHYWGREIAQLGHTVRLMPPCHDLAIDRPNEGRELAGNGRGGHRWHLALAQQ